MSDGPVGITFGSGAARVSISFSGTIISIEEPRTRIVYMKIWKVGSESLEIIVQSFVPFPDAHFAVLPIGCIYSRDGTNSLGPGCWAGPSELITASTLIFVLLPWGSNS